MDYAYGLNFTAAYGDDDRSKPMILNSEYGTGNSRAKHFTFDIKSEVDDKVFFCADIHRDDLVNFAKWVLDMVGEAHQTIITQDFEELESSGDGDIIYVYNGPVNNYYGGQHE